MQTTTPQYDSAIIDTIRKIRAKIEVTWTDPFIDPSLLAVTNDDNRISWPNHVVDLQEAPLHRWAHLDGTFKPDGTFYPAPSTQIEADGAQMGWWGQVSSGVGGVFSLPYPKLTLTFAARPVFALLVVGDSAYNEFPVDFEIKVYDGSDTLLYTETVTGNTDIRWYKDIVSESLTEIVKLTLEITKWSAADRVVKILEFYTSLVETYENEDIVSINILEEKEVRDGTLPVGNISANEVDIALQNVQIFARGALLDDPFFPANTNSYLHTLTKSNRRLKIWLGAVLPDTSIEYILMGTFWSGDWEMAEPEFSVRTSARDRMDLLRNATFSSSLLYENYTLYQLIQVVLIDARSNIPMHDLQWDIDMGFNDIVIPFGWFPKKSYMDTIRDLVSAGPGYAYMSRDDVLMVVL